MIYKSILRTAAMVALLVTGALQGGQFVPLSVEQLTAKSAIVLQGTVLSKTTLRDDAGRIYTRVQVAVNDVWKGNVSSNRFTIVQGGGILGDEKVTVSGQAEFKLGEEMVAFLVLNQRGEGVTLGLKQGKFDVQKDKTTGTKSAHNLFHGRDSGKKSEGAQSSASGNHALGLAELKRQVQEARQ